MTAKHTQGPWKIRELTCEDHRGMGWVEDANGRDIACCGAAELWLYENRANAALIARAPDLLADNDRLRAENEALRKGAERFIYLQNIDPKDAQAFFWYYSSRKQRAKAIDAARKQEK